jgi:anti-anti-sigma regulatory factor
MLTVHTENIGDTSVLDCEGRLAGYEACYELQDAVTSQANSKTLVLDLTELYEIDDIGLRMLSILQEWALEKDIQLKLFNPTSAVRNRLQHNAPLKSALASYTEIVLLAQTDNPQTMEQAKAA